MFANLKNRLVLCVLLALVSVLAVACGGIDEPVSLEDTGIVFYSDIDCPRHAEFHVVSIDDASTYQFIEYTPLERENGSTISTSPQLGFVLSPPIDDINWVIDVPRSVFVANDMDDNIGVYTSNLDGSDLMQITNDTTVLDKTPYSPNWSSDGNRIVFAAVDFDNTSTPASYLTDIYTVNADGSNLRRIVEGELFTITLFERTGFPAWSPDGTRVAFISANVDSSEAGLYVVNADGSDLELVVNILDSDSQFISAVSPVWSPDGSSVAFIGATSENVRDNIYTVNPDGSEPKQITNLEYNFTIIRPSIAWSPDGTHIAFSAELSMDVPNVQYSRVQQIYTASIDGSNLQQLINAPHSTEDCDVFGATVLDWLPDSVLPAPLP